MCLRVITKITKTYLKKAYLYIIVKVDYLLSFEKFEDYDLFQLFNY